MRVGRRRKPNIFNTSICYVRDLGLQEIPPSSFFFT